jgi:ADP-ribose pyrophosphatase YjhB (NUDIX family)
MDKLSKEVLRQHKGKSFVGVTTCFFCHDGKGSFFMAKRSQNNRDEQGTWEIGGGGLKWGQKAMDNAIREAKEEYNATPKQTELLGYRDVLRTQPDGTKTHWLALDFALLVDPKELRNNEPKTFDSVGWFSLDNLPSPLHSQQEPFFRQYKGQLTKLGIK